jgi:DNA-binding IclR family transcriptional regulator
VSNALRLLEAFREDEELGVTELSRRLGLHKNNVFRLLATLEGKGYVEQSDTSDRYRLGVGCVEVGQAFARTRSLVRQARSTLEHLARTHGESAHLGALRDQRVVHLDGEQGLEHLVQARLRVGLQLPAHCTALGKVLLGCAERDVRERFDREVVRGGALVARTSATITDREKFLEALHSVASQGFATDFGECENGLCCAAAPVYDSAGRLLAALSVSGPAFRLDPDRLLGDVVPAVRAAAEALSRQL